MCCETFSLFATGLAFADHALQDSTKIGILVASSVAAVSGGWILCGESAKYVATTANSMGDAERELVAR